ncbi:tRNA (adenosine(37)-N6)-threonylcarbamoyltransferase complex ATPase subunit type 1 TsaE [Candidatus Nomurabacteria bacterium CG10_big_fil_rev_8_21_14_0_10_35_16]|uniref:tRNA threonylcarbamoyladenosine biosynthesis protein TsaE n=1 Tax=Candidatus Nomurabacteria bacterium CG10_big_fil_rev_8_21_14_0_10_35_16 TaxID=1974731 RepID=A0A2H0TBJ5_9BACT|nr:MAG: tRNA (adenosine(37)-N6)-threonylcarbamoyltransferase complex ATPase subunit type 1 TsaE [Candidatus Nomurabacteria bacterium CG10_big_fil_rev_8_21_14_0_10_35_16]
MKKVSKNKTETSKIAKIFIDRHLKQIKNRKEAVVVGLLGDLGVGKTTFTQAVAKHLGVSNRVSSPTFVVIKKYPIKFKGYKFFFHIDAYRLKNEKEILVLGWNEIITQPEHIIFIEWPENVKKVIPKSSKLIHISHIENKHRGFEFK